MQVEVGVLLECRVGSCSYLSRWLSWSILKSTELKLESSYDSGKEWFVEWRGESSVICILPGLIWSSFKD